ncbi:hypothetical protein [Sphingobacterium spiritivorum]|uniref:hypothetical protein n=1 Tax=Sphingobacterium spiritivorum TaxID=258 RepID=UPI001F2ADA58|nr:hypothetical protein [Sphingobacterium spiritivorum]
MKNKILKTTGIALSIFFTHMASAQQDNRVQISLDAPAYGVNLLANFGTGVPGGWARGYRISNNDDSESFIQLGTMGYLDAAGKSFQSYSYIGKNYDRPFMIFQPDGNIGIGTTTVENNEGWEKALQINGTDHAKLLVTTNAIRTGMWSHNSGYYGAVTGGMVGTHTNHPFSIVTNGVSKVTILSNGYTGIGTTTPTERLAVNGNIRAKEIKVESANWPDYVFEEDYKLIPLAEVEAFIKANKHLPDVPSAKVIEEDGLSVGEMNKLMMKKIEELTLHLIEKEKRQEILSQRVHMLIEKVDQQASEINQLKNKR